MSEFKYVDGVPTSTVEWPDTRRYRVEIADGTSACEKCGHGAYWTVVYNDDDGEPIEVGTSWGDRETADSICDLMNMAYEAGQERPIGEIA